MMNLMVAPLCYILLIVPFSLGLDDQANDSLKSALEAISRRQRDLAAPGGYYGGSSLSQYHYPERENGDQLPFLAPPRDFTGDGQPENIGYGYQKSVPSQNGMFPSPQLISENVMDHHQPVNNKALEKLLVEYLEDEYKNDNTADDAYYHHGHSRDRKRSSFRERGSNLISEPREHFHPNIIGRLEAMHKRGERLHSLVPSSFRERVHSRLVGNDDNLEAEKRWYDFSEDLAKEAQEERDEIIEQEREREDRIEDDSQRYLDLLETVWEKFRQTKPNVVDIEDLTSEDVQEILSSLDNDEGLDEDDVREIKTEADKRQYEGGYDFFNNGGGMGGWTTGGSYKKRGKQRLDGNNDQQGNFLYSLKFVSPAANREAVETLKEEDSIELPDERDEDILRLTSNGFNRHEPETWIPTYEREEPIDEVYGPNEENYQRLILSQGGPNLASSSRKRVASLMSTNYGLRELPAPGLFIPDRHLEKKMAYESAMKRKRYPVTKRSSNFYTSPPLLHHKSFSVTDNLKEIRKKKDASVGTMNSVTDPKVARELNQIFSSSSIANDEISEEHVHESKPAGVGTPATKSETKIEQDSTTHTSVIPGVVGNNASSHDHPEDSGIKGHSDEKANNRSAKFTEHNDKKHLELKNKEQSLREDETVEQPITMSRIQTPLEIKKKSIDWSDYFGIDRRRKKTMPISINELEGSGDGTAIDDDWLLNQYYKTLAMSTNPVKKRMSLHSHTLPQSKDKKQNDNQPFDTRVFNADIFSRSAQREIIKKSTQSESNDESRIENMDTKLRNIEDLIVNEAVKYTGAHEGTTDPKEIQEVKDKIMSRLAAAYSLEKMRLALGEFKSSLQAQKMSKYNPENQKSSLVADDDEDKKKKRVAVKKEKAEEEKKKEDGKEDEKKKRDEHEKEPEEEENSGEFLQGPVDIEPMSEAYMGRQQPKLSHEDCPVLEHILRKCRTVGSFSGDSGQLFLPLCSLHQICYLCGPEVGSPSPSACDLMFLTEADSMCLGDQLCQRAARRSVMTLRQSQPDMSPSGGDEQCSNNSCIARYFLTSPLPNNQAR